GYASIVPQISFSHPLRHCWSLVRIHPHLCLSLLHDSEFRRSLFTPLGRDWLGCCQTRPYREGFRSGRPEIAAAYRDCHGLFHLVGRRGRTRIFCYVCEGRVAGRRCRSLRIEPLLDSGRFILCPPFLPVESPDHRRLLSSAV